MTLQWRWSNAIFNYHARKITMNLTFFSSLSSSLFKRELKNDEMKRGVRGKKIENSNARETWWKFRASILDEVWITTELSQIEIKKRIAVITTQKSVFKLNYLSQKLQWMTSRDLWRACSYKESLIIEMLRYQQTTTKVYKRNIITYLCMHVNMW